MKRYAALMALFLLPSIAGAATLRADDTLNLSEAPLGNAYLTGAEVTVSAPLPGDLLAAAGAILVNAPVAGDAFLLAGTVTSASPIAGDLRVAGTRVRVDGDVEGELAALAGALTVTGKAKEVRAAGGTVEFRSGAAGPVTIYGGSVSLAGEFAGDVRVVASDHVSLADGTVIRGTFEYNAPQEAGIPPSAVIEGGAQYVGSASFLPTEAEARTFALAGVGLFLLVRLVAAMLTAGLLAGLFPEAAKRIADRVLVLRPKPLVLYALLGFAAIVATPIAIVLLLASFVGIGLAALLGAAYLLALLLSYLYAAIILGAAFMRLVLKRQDVPWKSALLGMLALYAVGLVPTVGLAIGFVLSAIALGAMLAAFYRFAFGRSAE